MSLNRIKPHIAIQNDSTAVELNGTGQPGSVWVGSGYASVL
jgi:hypothetical protein